MSTQNAEGSPVVGGDEVAGRDRWEEGPHNWPDGKYLNRCGFCSRQFKGWKRQVACKLCTAEHVGESLTIIAPSVSDEPRAEGREQKSDALAALAKISRMIMGTEPPPFLIADPYKRLAAIQNIASPFRAEYERTHPRPDEWTCRNCGRFSKLTRAECKYCETPREPAPLPPISDPSEPEVRGLAKGCHRAHPHENMSEACGVRTELAKLRNQIARPTPSDGDEEDAYEAWVDEAPDTGRLVPLARSTFLAGYRAARRTPHAQPSQEPEFDRFGDPRGSSEAERAYRG